MSRGLTKTGITINYYASIERGEENPSYVKYHNF